MTHHILRRTAAAALGTLAIAGASVLAASAPAFADDGTQITLENNSNTAVVVQFGTFSSSTLGTTSFPDQQSQPSITLQPGQSQTTYNSDSSDESTAMVSTPSGTNLVYLQWYNPVIGCPYYAEGAGSTNALSVGQQNVQVIDGYTFTFTRTPDGDNKNLVVDILGGIPTTSSTADSTAAAA